MLQRVALAEISWLTPGEGGRQRPPTGPVYAATARFQEDPIDQSFSVVLRFPPARPPSGQEPEQVKLQLLAPENLPNAEQRLVPGSRLLITEGPRIVAVCQVVSVNQEKTGPPFDAKAPYP